MGTRSFRLFITPDEFGQAVHHLIQMSRFHLYCHLWPCRDSGPVHRYESVAKTAVVPLLERTESRTLIVTDRGFEALERFQFERDVERSGSVRIDVPHIRDGQLNEIMIACVTEYWDLELGRPVALPNVAPMYDLVVRPFRRLARKPVYYLDSGQVRRMSSYTEGAAQFQRSGGVLIDDAKLCFSVDPPTTRSHLKSLNVLLG